MRALRNFTLPFSRKTPSGASLANSQIHISSDINIETIEIIDAFGKTIEVFAPSTNSINISDLTNGIYFLKIQTDKGFVSKMFLKN